MQGFIADLNKPLARFIWGTMKQNNKFVTAAPLEEGSSADLAGIDEGTLGLLGAVLSLLQLLLGLPELCQVDGRDLLRLLDLLLVRLDLALQLVHQLVDTLLVLRVLLRLELEFLDLTVALGHLQNVK